jgi:colanic acid biosynthesis glycosyl transferase WcaI
MSKKKITAMLMYWYPYVGALQPIYRSIFRHLSEDGYEISILAGVPHYRRGRDELWCQYRRVLYAKSVEDGLLTRRVFVFSPRRLPFMGKHGILRRLLNSISFFISASLACLLTDRGSRPCVLFVPTFPPFVAGLLGCLISTVRRVPFVYNVQDIHPDVLYSVRFFRLRPVSWLLRKVEGFSYARAKQIVTISDSMKENLHEKGVPLGKIIVVPNFCDTDSIKPMPKGNDFSRLHGLHDKFTVLYAGNIGQPQGVEFIVNAAAVLRDCTDIMFVFVGRGERKQEAENLVRNLRLENVVFIPLQPPDRMSLVWGSADVALVSLRKNMSRGAFPSKIYGILSSATPMVAMVDRGSEIWQLAEQSEVGVCVEAEDSLELANTIKSLRSRPGVLRKMGDNGRKLVEARYSKETILRQYKSVFDKICD